MNKRFRLNRNRLLMGLACGLAMLAFEGRGAHAGIMLTMSVNGGAQIDITALFTPFATDPTQQNSLGSPNLDAINALLVGSAYTFTGLGGSSNWSGSPSGGTLSLNGGVQIVAGTTGTTGLTLTETESGFTSPSGTTGTLQSASTSTFTDAGPGNSHDANSLFNTVTTPTYTVASTTTGADSVRNSANAAIAAFVTPYTLTNFISFHLTPNPNSTPTDNFGVGATVTASGAIIPEPASLAMMSIGLPLPLMGLAWLRRRRKAEARAA
jgi:hypothetical protein